MITKFLHVFPCFVLLFFALPADAMVKRTMHAMDTGKQIRQPDSRPPKQQRDRVRLESPDGNIVFSFNLNRQAPVYRVDYKGNTLVEDSELGLSFQGGNEFRADLEMGPVEVSLTDETYELVVGKAKTVRNHYRQATILLVERKGKRRRINLVVRAFNDGVAFRYEFPEQENWESYVLTDENSSFNIAGDPTVTTLFFDNYTSSHEGPYHRLPLSEISPDILMDMPALFEFSGNSYMAITEANLRNYAGMYLVKQEGGLKSRLSPLPNQQEIPGRQQVKVKALLPHRTPWRVMLIGDRIGTLIESNIITSLNEPTAINDLSWIKPGKTTFHWWNGDIIPDTTFAPGINFATNKYYIDFCARNKIDYHSVIGYGGVAWYQHDGTGFSTARIDSGKIRPLPGFDIQRVCEYARQKGVGIHVWVHWQAIYPNLEENFAQFEKWGINGMMVDFMDRDDQEMVNIQENILRSAARHQLFIQFHGSFKPTGLSRTYPNEFTREGTLNYEVNKWQKEGLSPDHDIMMPFTRMLAGPADYHLGGFRAVPPAEFKTQYTRPLMTGTRCHMLAMYVVMESYLASLCDYPAAYQGQEGFEFLLDVPTTWDETSVLNAMVGEFITIARRKGAVWYVASLNNTQPRSVEVPLDFLPPGTYMAEIYTDAADAAENPNNLDKQTKVITAAGMLKLDLAAGGGQVMRIKRLEDSLIPAGSK